MRFASINASDASQYTYAGKAGADSLAKTFEVQRKTGPDYGGLSKVAMVTQSQEKIEAMKAAEKVTNAGVNAFAHVKQIANNEGANRKIREIDRKRKSDFRKAGAIAGLGKIAGAAYLASRKDERVLPTNSKEKRSLLEQSIKQQQGILEQMDANDRKGIDDGDALINNNTPTYSSPSTGVDSGKAVEGGGTTVSQTGSGAADQTAWGRLAKVIKTGEGTVGDAGYTTMFTGARFSDTSRHPRQINRSGSLASDAAGAYQFLSTTWDGARSALNLPDFSPASQEKAGRYLAQKRGINPDAVYNTKQELAQALDKIAPEWASMPTLRTGTSYYGQGGISLDQAWKIYNGG